VSASEFELANFDGQARRRLTRGEAKLVRPVCERCRRNRAVKWSPGRHDNTPAVLCPEEPRHCSVVLGRVARLVDRTQGPLRCQAARWPCGRAPGATVGPLGPLGCCSGRTYYFGPRCGSRGAGARVAAAAYRRRRRCCRSWLLRATSAEGCCVGPVISLPTR